MTTKKETVEDWKNRSIKLRSRIREIEDVVNSLNKQKYSQEKKGNKKVIFIPITIVFVYALVFISFQYGIPYYNMKSGMDKYVSFKTETGMRCSGTQLQYVDSVYLDFFYLRKAIETFFPSDDDYYSDYPVDTTASFYFDDNYCVYDNDRKSFLLSIDTSGDWVIVYDENAVCSEGLNTNLKNYIEKYKRTFYMKDLNLCNNGYLVLLGKNYFVTENIPSEALEFLHKNNKQGDELLSATYNTRGEWCVLAKNHYAYSDQNVKEFCSKAMNFYGTIHYVYFSDRGKIAICKKGIYFENIPSNVVNSLKWLRFNPTKIKFLDNGFYVITNDEGQFEYYLRNEKTLDKELRRYVVNIIDKLGII